MSTIAKPFLKWAGGKGQLLDKFQDLYPKPLLQGQITTYCEPFLGSGAVFFDIVQKYNIQRACLYDINPELIITYQVIQKDVEKLIDLLRGFQKKYALLDATQRKQFFYEQRSAYNQQRHEIDLEKYSNKWYDRAAQFIFLNRTCFNGLYRVNSKGEFNTPAGEYKNPKICDEVNLRAVHQVLQIAEIRKADFNQISIGLNDNTFVYFDPPYRPISKTASFKAYDKGDFTDEDQMKLSRLFKQLDKNGAYLMLSNSDPKNSDPADDFFDKLYAGYHIKRVPARRIINSNPSKRGAINEIVVTNYPTD